MSANAVTICSNALLKLGSRTIASLTENTDEARLCANLYAPTRDRLLRSHPWNFAIKRDILAPDVETPVFDYSAQFTIPPDWLKTLQVGTNYENIDWRPEGRKILANASALSIRYIYRNEDEETWEPLAIHGLTLMMAAELAYPITESTGLRESLLQEMQMVLREARAVDGQDAPPEEFGDFPLLTIRYGG